MEMNGLKVAVLVASGFDEVAYMAMQPVWKAGGAVPSFVSAGVGLLNGWRGDDWGLNYPADFQLSSALAADFDIVFVPGGRRSIDKIMMTAHTKRFMASFMAADKPVVLFDEASDIMAFAGVEGCVMADEDSHVDGMLFTAKTSSETMDDMVKKAAEFLASTAQDPDDEKQAA